MPVRHKRRRQKFPSSQTERLGRNVDDGLYELLDVNDAFASEKDAPLVSPPIDGAITSQF